jgi:hypothetical protein
MSIAQKNGMPKAKTRKVRARELAAGPKLLESYLEKEELSMTQFGDSVDCTKGHICGIVSGKTPPGLQLALRIEVVTAGKVPAKSWRSLKAS